MIAPGMESRPDDATAFAVRPATGGVRILHLHADNLYGGVETLLVTLANLLRLCPTMKPNFALCMEGRWSKKLVSTSAQVHLLGAVRISRPWRGEKSQCRP